MRIASSLEYSTKVPVRVSVDNLFLVSKADNAQFFLPCLEKAEVLVPESGMALLCSLIPSASRKLSATITLPSMAFSLGYY